VVGGYRIVQKPFVADGKLYGPGWAYFSNIYNWWVTANTLPDDPAQPPSYVRFIPVEGLAAAYDALETWQRNNPA
jgi:hypothetical protein